MLEVTSQLPVKPEELAPLPSPIPHTWPPGSSLTILIRKGGEGKAGEAWEHGPVPSPAVACLEERPRTGEAGLCTELPQCPFFHQMTTWGKSQALQGQETAGRGRKGPC